MSARRAAPALVLLVAALAVVPAGAATSAARKPQKRSVSVIDNEYVASKLTVNRGSTITWIWSEDAADLHDLKLSSGPKGVRQSTLTSDAGSAGYEFRRTLKVPGVYKFVCTFHIADGMKMSIVVRK